MHFLTHLGLVKPSNKRVDSLVLVVGLASDFLSYLTRHRVSFIVSSGNVYRLQYWFFTDSSTFVRYSGLLTTGGQTTRTTGTSYFPSLRRFMQPFVLGQIASCCCVEFRSVSRQQLSPSARACWDRVGALTCSRLSWCAPDCGHPTSRGYTATDRSF